MIFLSLTVLIKIVEMLLNFYVEEAFGDLGLGLWKFWQSCAEDAVPLALQKDIGCFANIRCLGNNCRGERAVAPT